MLVKLKDIRTDGGTQARIGTYPDVVRDYAEDMTESLAKHLPWPFPPIVIFQEAENLWLADGFHRVEAAIMCQKEQIEADVRPGCLRDAIFYAAGANQDHGLQLTPGDKRAAVKLMLADQEWRTWSDSALAMHCKCSPPTVAKIKEEMGIDLKSFKSKEGKVTTRNGRQMNTANIGRKKKPRQTELHEHYNPPVTEDKVEMRSAAPPVVPPEEIPDALKSSQEMEEALRPDRVMLESALDLVRSMREAQKEYRKTKQKELLTPMRQLENMVDTALIALEERKVEDGVA